MRAPPLRHVYDTHADLRPFSCSIIYRNMAACALNACCMDLLAFKNAPQASSGAPGWMGNLSALIHKLFSPLLQTGCRETRPRPEVGTLLGTGINPPGSTGISRPTWRA